MKRFQEWIKQARGDLPPWASLPEECIPIVAAHCELPDLADLLDELDNLAKEKTELPDWDGDSHADIGKAQELFARILAALPRELQPHLLERLKGRNQETQDWVQLALSERQK